jgi:hypothetical protein
MLQVTGGAEATDPFRSTIEKRSPKLSGEHDDRAAAAVGGEKGKQRDHGDSARSDLARLLVQMCKHMPINPFVYLARRKPTFFDASGKTRLGADAA